MFSAALAQMLAFWMLRYPAVWTTLFVLAAAFFLYVALHEPRSVVFWVLGATLSLLVMVPLLFARHHNRLVGFLSLVVGIGSIALPGHYRTFDTVVGGLVFMVFGVYGLVTNKIGESVDDVVGIEPGDDEKKQGPNS